MTHSEPAREAVALREKIANFIDENAEVRGDHPSDFAILINADELAASIVELIPLAWAASPAPAAGGLEAVAESVDVAAWRKAMEGVTPGPWRGTGRYVGTPNHLSFIGECRDQNGNWTDEAHAKRHAAWVARCSPASVAALLDEIERLRAALAAPCREGQE